MSRKEYMEKLEQLLTNIPQSEKQEVLQYYEDYFADAGEEREEEVIAGLGTAEQLAERIKADLNDGPPEGEFTERGYQEPEYEKQEYPAGKSGEPYGGKKRKWDRNQILLIIILCILALPLLAGIGGGLLGLVCGGLAALFGILVGFSAVAFALTAGGIGLIVGGIAQIWAAPAVGFALLGVGCVLLALGVVFICGVIYLWGELVPKLFKGIVKLIRRLFRGKETVV